MHNAQMETSTHNTPSQTRYFKSNLSDLIWKFTEDGSFVRSSRETAGGWQPSVMIIDDMAVTTFEITAEEGEP